MLEAVHALRSQRHFQEALSRLTTLKQHNPDNAEVLWRRALILTDLGKVAEKDEQSIRYYQRALGDSNAALKVDSTSAWIHAVKAMIEGRLCLHVGIRERARRSFEVKQHADRALALDSTLALAYHVRGRWHRDIADLNFIQRRFVKLYGDLPEASLEEAVQDLKRAVELNSKSYGHLGLARTYLEMDQEKKAREHLRLALGSWGSPLDPEYKEEAGHLLVNLR